MKIRQKLTLGFLTVVLLVGAVGYICLYQLYRIAEPLNKDIPEAVKAINETSRLDGLAQFIRYYDEVLTQSARNYAFTRDKKWEQRYRDVEPKLDKIIKEAIWRGDEKDKEFFSSVDKANLALVEMEYESIELVHNGQIEKAIKILEGNEYWDQKKIHEQALRGYVHRKGVRYDEALAGSTDKTELANNQAQNLIRTSTLLVLGFVVFALTLSAGIGFLISYSISNPIAKLKAATAKIGAGQLDTQIEINSNDEIGQLAASFKKMAEDLKRTTTSIDNLNAVNQQLESEITKRRETTAEIAQLARFPSENPNPVLRISKDGIILYSNESSRPILDIWGCEQGERVSEDLREAILQVLKTGKLYTPEVECDEKIYSLTFSSIKNGDFVNVYGLDITERKKAKETLLRSERKYRTLLENLPQKIFLKDKNSVYISCNGNYARDLNIKSDEIAGRTDHEFYPKEFAEKYRVDDRRIMESGVTEDIEEIYIQDGEEIIVHTVKTPVKDEQGNAIGILGIFWDITERKRAEQALEKLNKDLESTIRELSKSNEELQDFAHIAAHDLKAPLRAMGTLADWLLTDYGDNFDEKGREKIKLLTARAKRMSRHIDSALQYAELGHAVQEKEKVNLNRLVKEVIGEIAPPENVEITVVCELPTITCERTYMMQVFGNLLDNALKYMDKPEGRIKVGCVEEDGFWKFSVSDNGPGIEQKYFGKVFKIFQTLLPRDEFEATGIGLATVKKIVELYNGKIWVESNPGQGSTFFFTLPKQEMGVNDAKHKTDIACRG